jgi:pyruvate, orthophosphate dikinase
LRRLDGVDLRTLVNKRLMIGAAPVGHGTCASSGIAVGRAAFDSDTASSFADAAQAVILVRPDTTAADVAGFASAAGIVTAVGGRTAHAALVARQMGKPCIVGCLPAAWPGSARPRSAKAIGSRSTVMPAPFISAGARS